MNSAPAAAPVFNRRSSLLRISCVILAASAVSCRRAENAADESSPAIAAPVIDSPTRTITDAVKVFQSAFWRRPAAGDEILGAERREWSDENGLSKWQWFIAVRPSPGLLKYLREDNAFGLVKTDYAPAAAGAPSWFAGGSAGGEAMRSPASNLRINFSDSDHVIYASSSGGGLLPGAPERPAPVPPQISSSGRLSLTPPPVPPPPTP